MVTDSKAFPDLRIKDATHIPKDGIDEEGVGLGRSFCSNEILSARAKQKLNGT
jgi:hypothetical protein